MNFQTVDGLMGQKDSKGYQIGVPGMTSTIREISPAEYNKQGKHIQQVKLQDSQGRVEKVKIYLGNGPEILPTDVNTLQMFQQVALNDYKGTRYYMAFWDNMHPPQGQPQAAHLNAATQAIIDKHREPQAAEQMAGATADSQRMQGDSFHQPTQQDYAAKEREKVLGMCFTNLLSGRLSNMFAVDMEKDLGEIAAIWRLAAMCIDGTGRVTEEPNF